MRSTLTRSKPASCASRDRARDVARIVRAPERGEHVRRHRLHAEAQAIDAARAIRTELGGVDAVGVALHRDLGVHRYGRSRRGSVRVAPRPTATACLHRRTRRSRPGGRHSGDRRDRQRTRRRTRRSGAHGRSTSRSRSSHSERHRTGCARTRRRAVVPPVQATAPAATGWLCDTTTPPAFSTVTANERTGPLAWKARACGSGPSTPAETTVGRAADPVTAHS